MEKYDFPSPILVTKQTSPKKLAKKPEKLTNIYENPEKSSQVPTLQTLKPVEIETLVIPDEKEDRIKKISIEEINPADFNVMLLVDTSETLG